MDSELLNSSLSGLEEQNTDNSVPYFSYTDTFEEMFPYYLSIGMTEEQYWDKDNKLVIYYRKAEELRIEKNNQIAWLQGQYFYDGMARLYPLFNPYVKKGSRVKPYLQEPYPITKKNVKEQKEKKEKKENKQALAFMEMFTVKNNERFKTKGSE